MLTALLIVAVWCAAVLAAIYIIARALRDAIRLMRALPQAVRDDALTVAYLSAGIVGQMLRRNVRDWAGATAALACWFVFLWVVMS